MDESPRTPAGRVNEKGILSLVVPLYNEADAVPFFLERIGQLATTLDPLGIEVIAVNDGSTDDSLSVLRQLAPTAFALRIVDLSRNFGKEAAITAGLEYATGQAVAPIDVDLQDPPELLVDMVREWRAGYEVVLAKRVNRATDSWLKRHTALWFYQTHNRISRPKIPENVGDFRLMDRAVVDAINRLPESMRFMKGSLHGRDFGRRKSPTRGPPVRPARSR